MKRLYTTQVVVLAAGSVFAWVTVVQDFLRFYSYEGTIFKITDCVVPNPVTTPCFYGAFAFVIATIWAIKLIRRPMGNRLSGERKLRWFLVASTLFAWGNFGYVLYSLYAPSGSGKGCSGLAVTNPFATPCFIGSAIFLVTLVLTEILIRKEHTVETVSNPPAPSGPGGR